jgi:two-component system response regulator (stage 0 sporulation protein F)
MDKEIKILLVDDEPDFTQTMTSWLRSKGYSVEVASNGMEAVDMIKKETPDIVFLDINMPVMDGLQTLRKIREFNEELPVIIISAYVDDPKTQMARNYGVSGVFNKGSDFSNGLTLLEATLRTHRKLKS